MAWRRGARPRGGGRRWTAAGCRFTGDLLPNPLWRHAKRAVMISQERIIPAPAFMTSSFVRCIIRRARCPCNRYQNLSSTSSAKRQLRSKWIGHGGDRPEPYSGPHARHAQHTFTRAAGWPVMFQARARGGTDLVTACRHAPASRL
jgi:hypothetical protein